MRGMSTPSLPAIPLSIIAAAEHELGAVEASADGLDVIVRRLSPERPVLLKGRCQRVRAHLRELRAYLAGQADILRGAVAAEGRS